MPTDGSGHSLCSVRRPHEHRPVAAACHLPGCSQGEDFGTHGWIDVTLAWRHLTDKYNLDRLVRAEAQRGSVSGRHCNCTMDTFPYVSGCGLLFCLCHMSGMDQRQLGCGQAQAAGRWLGHTHPCTPPSAAAAARAVSPGPRDGVGPVFFGLSPSALRSPPAAAVRRAPPSPVPRAASFAVCRCAVPQHAGPGSPPPPHGGHRLRVLSPRLPWFVTGCVCASRHAPRSGLLPPPIPPCVVCILRSRLPVSRRAPSLLDALLFGACVCP